MSASIWNPSGTVVPTANADNTLKTQVFTATAGQTLFTLTLFTYQPATQSLLVIVNGVDQILTTDYLETSGSSITFTSALELNDEVVIRGFVGGTAAQAASASAAAAAASQVQTAADKVACDADKVACDADVVAANLAAANATTNGAIQVALAAGQAGLAQNYAQLANITDYGSITGATTFTADYGSV